MRTLKQEPAIADVQTINGTDPFNTEPMELDALLQELFKYFNIDSLNFNTACKAFGGNQAHVLNLFSHEDTVKIQVYLTD